MPGGSWRRGESSYAARRSTGVVLASGVSVETVSHVRAGRGASQRDWPGGRELSIRRGRRGAVAHKFRRVVRANRSEMAPG